MNKYLTRIISILLILTMLFTVPAISETNPPPLSFDGTQSAWAEAELLLAYNYNLTYPLIMNNFKKSITREEFSTIAVKLYESLTGQTALTTTNPFSDTNNPEILKAYKLGIVKGISATEFAPGNNITRQEICVMIYRALDVSIPALDKDVSGAFLFTDQNKIASWALTEMKFAFKNQIMRGFEDNTIGPLQNTTREQAIVLLKRTFENFSDTPTFPDNTLGTITTYKPSLLRASDLTRYREMPDHTLFFPKYDERVSLYAASTPTKPASKPSTSFQLIRPIFNTGIILPEAEKSIYSNSSYTTFIDKNLSQNRWFAFTLNNATGVKKIVWQVSVSPFIGYTDNWKAPLGLLASGEADASLGEFQIDFGNLKKTSSFIQTGLISSTASYKPIEQKHATYYVRAVAVDSFGLPIGEPGKGIAVIYGERVINYNPTEKISSAFQVWTPTRPSGGFSGEILDLPSFKSVFRVDPRANENRMFHFKGIDSTYDKIAVQIVTESFPSTGGGWPNTPNVIFEQEYQLPITTMYTDFPNSIYVDFTKFAEPASQMKEGQYIKYYLRGVAFKKSTTPGTYDVSYSTPVTIEYGYNPPTTYYSDDPYKSVTTLKVSKPDVKILNYTKPQWPDKNYMHHYYVYTAPKAADIKCNWRNIDTNEILYPYKAPYIEAYASQGIKTAQDYETKVIPRVLPVGTTIYFQPPKEEDKSWWQQLFEGVVNFFKDLAFAVKTIVNQVSTAYANLKAGLVNFVVNLCPIEALKGPFKLALEAYLNYGLMAIGIPPTLPNFDQLAEQGMNYFAEVALTEAGIPVTDLTKDQFEKIVYGIANEIDKAANHADFNPVDAPFLKLDPNYMYKPGYVDIEVSNTTNVPSIAGTFDIKVTFELDHYNMINPVYPLSLNLPSNYSYQSGAAFTNAATYREHFVNGLNGHTVNYSQGYKAIYDVLNPQLGIKIPILQPYEKRTVRVYLNPYDGKQLSNYPMGENFSRLDFENMYFGNGNKKFTHFNLISRFPTAEEYMKRDGVLFYLDPTIKYVFTNEHNHKGYEKIQMPVSASWTK
ncbi:MAG: S-layer homology domain-containing protein [Eubacteriales bacterium]|nr:S-layer homology domain-containing protein [Eubacteriales bacterium]